MINIYRRNWTDHTQRYLWEEGETIGSAKSLEEALAQAKARGCDISEDNVTLFTSDEEDRMAIKKAVEKKSVTKATPVKATVAENMTKATTAKASGKRESSTSRHKFASDMVYQEKFTDEDIYQALLAAHPEVPEKVLRHDVCWARSSMNIGKNKHYTLPAGKRIPRYVRTAEGALVEYAAGVGTGAKRSNPKRAYTPETDPLNTVAGINVHGDGTGDGSSVTEDAAPKAKKAAPKATVKAAPKAKKTTAKKAAK